MKYGCGPLAAWALACCICWAAEHGKEPPTGNAARAATSLDEEAGGIFKKRCYSCHKSDGIFDPKTFLPTAQFKDEVLKRLRSGGDDHMPPPERPQLTDAEKKQIDAWAEQPPGPQPLADGCAEAKGGVSDERGKALMRAACVQCHGKIDIGLKDALRVAAIGVFGLPDPRQLIRGGHTQFLNNDGSIDQTVTGDDAEIAKGQLPDDKTTLARIQASLASGIMPPRKAMLGIHTKLDDQEREDLVNWLGQQKKAAGCPVTSFNTLVSPDGKQRPLSFSLERAAAACQSLGQKVPTIRQLEKLHPHIKDGLLGNQGCVWSSSLSGDASMPRYIWSFDGIDGGPGRGIASEGYGCKVVCVP